METPNTIESVQPGSGQYSLEKDLRLNFWMAVAVVVYLVVLQFLKSHQDWTPLTRGLLALTPIVPGVLYVRTCMRFIRGMDELQRRIQLEAWLFAALGALIISTVINTLNGAGVALGRLNHGLSLFGAFALTFVLWIIGSALANRRYK